MKSSRAGHVSRPQNNVNDKLHTLRGEQFRHLRNRGQTHPDAASTSSPHSNRSQIGTLGTLPTDCTLIIPPPSSTYFSIDDHVQETSVENTSHSGARKNPPTWSGPSPPKSWTLTHSKDVHTIPEWRAKALHLVSNQSSDVVPALSMMCLRTLRALSVQDFAEIMSYLPRHLCCQLMRDSAIHSPLHHSYLYPLLGSAGHANGEIIIVGPQATVHDDHFSRFANSTQAADDWDSPAPSTSVEPLTTVALVSVRLPVATMLTFPPTITHLALVHLSAPIPLHRLPALCPLLVVLDLSYNEWLGYQQTESNAQRNVEGIRMLERVDWGRWQHLAVLGLRECFRMDDVTARINKGRWDDVQIIW